MAANRNLVGAMVSPERQPAAASQAGRRESVRSRAKCSSAGRRGYEHRSIGGATPIERPRRARPARWMAAADRGLPVMQVAAEELRPGWNRWNRVGSFRQQTAERRMMPTELVLRSI